MVISGVGATPWGKSWIRHWSVSLVKFNLVFHDKHRIAQNLHACKSGTICCDLEKNH